MPPLLDSSSPPVDLPCHVGVICALAIEAGSLVERLAGCIKIQGSGFVVRAGGLAGKRICVVESGVGQKLARRATEALIQGHRPQWLICAGFAGGLSDQLALGDLVLANQLVGLDGNRLAIDFSLPEAPAGEGGRVHAGPLLTVNRVITSPSEKKQLGETHQAIAVDMEALAVAQVAAEAKVRLIVVKAISDPVDRLLPAEISHLLRQKSNAGRWGAALGAIVRRPASVKELWQLREDAILASERLASFIAGIIPQLP